MRPVEAPWATAASTKSRCFRLRTSARTVRAMGGQLARVRAATTVAIPGPRMAASRMASRSPGNAKARSVARMSASSSDAPDPRRHAAQHAAADHRRQHGGAPDQEGDAAAVGQPGQEVAPVLVGPQQVEARRALERGVEILLVVAIGQHLGEQRRAGDDGHEHGRRHHRRAVAEERRPSASRAPRLSERSGATRQLDPAPAFSRRGGPGSSDLA